MRRRLHLSPLEHRCLEFLWENGTATAEEVRAGLAESHPMKESTCRTILGRLVEKGYVNYETVGRTYVYRAAEEQQSVAARAIRSVIDRFCGGSVEALLVGMVSSDVVSREELEEISRRLSEKAKEAPGA